MSSPYFLLFLFRAQLNWLVFQNNVQFVSDESEHLSLVAAFHLNNSTVSPLNIILTLVLKCVLSCQGSICFCSTKRLS